MHPARSGSELAKTSGVARDTTGEGNSIAELKPALLAALDEIVRQAAALQAEAQTAPALRVLRAVRNLRRQLEVVGLLLACARLADVEQELALSDPRPIAAFGALMRQRARDSLDRLVPDMLPSRAYLAFRAFLEPSSPPRGGASWC